MIKEYFDSKKYIRYNKTDIRIKEENSKYYFEVDYGNLTSNEYAILKKARNVKIFESKIVFDYKNGICECAYDFKDRQKILNFFKNKDIIIIDDNN